jgi:hypothetical protein
MKMEYLSRASEWTMEQRAKEPTGACHGIGRRTLVVGLAVMALARPAGAEETIPAWAQAAVADARNVDSQKTSVASGYVRSEIEKLLDSAGLVVTDNEVKVERLLVVKPWKAQPGLAVAASEVRRYRKSGSGSQYAGAALHLAVFSGQSGSALEVRATTSIEMDQDTSLEGLDLAAYRVAPDTIAMGVRTSKEFTCPDCSYGGGHNLYLTLFVVDGKQLVAIWSTRMASSSWEISPAKDDMSRDHDYYGSDEPATISVLKSVSRGHFDLRKSNGRRSCTYRWDGKQYGCGQEDPVKDWNDYRAKQ